MKVLLQRVTRASVTVDQAIIGKIESGLVLLIGFGQSDDESVLQPMAARISNLRIFENEAGKMHHSVKDTTGAILAVPQFTLYGRSSKGRRPDFTQALPPDKATKLFDQFVQALKAETDAQVETGQFGAHMEVALVNDGPVTLMLESPSA